MVAVAAVVLHDVVPVGVEDVVPGVVFPREVVFPEEGVVPGYDVIPGYDMVVAGVE